MNTNFAAFWNPSLLRSSVSTSPKLLKTRSRAADDATADCSTTMKSMKPSGRLDNEPKAFHHVTGLLARPLVVKKEAGKEVASAWKAMAAGGKLHLYRLATPSLSRSAQGSARHPGTRGETCRQPGGRAWWWSQTSSGLCRGDLAELGHWGGSWRCSRH